MNKSRLLGAVCCCILVLSITLPTVTFANFISNTITAEWLFNFSGTLSTLETHDVVVGTNVELPSSVIESDHRFDIDIGDNYILFSFSELSPFQNTSLNGWQFTDTLSTITDITGFNIGSLTGSVVGLESADLSFSSESIMVNFGDSGSSNVIASAGSTIRLDVQFNTVPLPPALWLFGSGLLGLIGIARRKPA